MSWTGVVFVDFTWRVSYEFGEEEPLDLAEDESMAIHEAREMAIDHIAGGINYREGALNVVAYEEKS